MEEQFKIESNEVLIRFLLSGINLGEGIEELCEVINAAVQSSVALDAADA